MCNSCGDHCHHDDEKIRKETVEEFKNFLFEKLNEAKKGLETEAVIYTISVIEDLIKSYNPPCKHFFEVIYDYEEKKEILQNECCACHLNPPCSFCTTTIKKCTICGEIEIKTY